MRLDEQALHRVGRWIEKAGEDLRAAQVLRAAADAPASTVAFHVQQAIEKSPKAYLVACQRFPGKVHDLGLLLRRAAVLDTDFTPHLDAVETWTDFAVEERYPADWRTGPGPVDLDAGIMLARALRDLVDAKIRGELPDPPP